MHSYSVSAIKSRKSNGSRNPFGVDPQDRREIAASRRNLAVGDVVTVQGKTGAGSHKDRNESTARVTKVLADGTFKVKYVGTGVREAEERGLPRSLLAPVSMVTLPKGKGRASDTSTNEQPPLAKKPRLAAPPEAKRNSGKTSDAPGSSRQDPGRSMANGQNNGDGTKT